MPGPVRRSPVPAAENRERILRAAGEVVARRGVEQTRYADIAAHAGVSISTLQYLFGTLDALVVAVIAHQAREYLTVARTQVEAIADPVVRLAWVIDHFVTADVDEDEARADWLVWVEYWRAAARDPNLHDDSFAAYEGWRALVADAVDAGVASGAFVPVIAADEIAQGILAMSDGLGIQIVLGHGGMTRRRASRLTRSWAAAMLACPQLTDVRPPRGTLNG